jgi:hypothetical protein
VSEIRCLACDRPAIATVASGDATVEVDDAHTVCEVRPYDHDGIGFRYFIHEKEA